MNRVEEYIPQEPIPSAATPPPPKPKKPYLEWLTPSECIAFEPPDDFILAGDCHLTRGGITILAGAPGVGKSRAAMGLAISGATGCDWMGYEVKSKWKTLIVQAENGPFRLKGEFTEIQESCSADLDEFVRVTPPPIRGMAFDNLEFVAELKEKITDFKPGLIIIDPWNRACAGDRQTDAQLALEGLLSCLPEDLTERPAILIVHHLRKKGADHSRKRGRDLLHELAGTYATGSSARAVVTLEPASSDPEDDRVVMTCCKNNDGPEGPPTAWHRRNGLFAPAENFDWEAFHKGDSPARSDRISIEAVKAALVGTVNETRKQLVEKLEAKGVCGSTYAYDLIASGPDFLVEETKGRFYYREIEDNS